METASTLPWKHCLLALCCVIPYPVQSWMLIVVQRPWLLDGKVLVRLSRKRRVQLRGSLWIQSITTWLALRHSTVYFRYNCWHEMEKTDIYCICHVTVHWHSVKCQKKKKKIKARKHWVRFVWVIEDTIFLFKKSYLVVDQHEFFNDQLMPIFGDQGGQGQCPYIMKIWCGFFF